MAKVAILGAGISGLTTAWYLKKKYPGIVLDIFEKREQAGGNIRSISLGGHITELGPRGIRPKGKGKYFLELVHELGLQEQLIKANKAARKRYLYMDGKLEKLPSGPLDLFGSRLLKGAWKTLRKEFLDKVPAAQSDDETVYEFVERRFGAYFAETLADPLFTGIYAGDIRKLSARAVIPHMIESEEKYGSVLKGFLAEPAEEAEVEGSFGDLEKTPLLSIRGGMQEICDRLAEELAPNLRLETAISSLDPLLASYDKVISTLPAYVLAGMVEEPLRTCLQSVEYAPIALVALNFNEKPASPEGFGYLVASGQEQPILGCIFNDQTFPELSVNKGASFTVMIGGSRMKDFFRYSKEDFLSIARETLAVHLKSSRFRVPDASFVQVWPQAIPQYNTGYMQILEAIKKETKKGKLVVSGNFISGIAVSDCIRHAKLVASQALLAESPELK
ncbi:oxygen-dependent protoporphyrinogen oxidase [Anseongella ginsenosidimutans]|uniref:Coproporphyrinogen III oxidase n=1 Tax=Anseongella ginsenosidimutans TaxID=496056 RepID=A0A4R3KQE4_9SPHI|nr:protoporphyrinogen oxidase [Anseongella ginsenosidimutans]QEC53838.1 protoporphyrinogen oxidase [Anseongella ginsenosidimutans]TCS86211.1 oxygen-dependent protoporphyrinogen oxidase [Anseongella ginsenosidimutans]